MGFIFTIVAFSVIFGVKCNQGYPNDNKPTPHDVQRVREQLRNALKDPAMTEAVIEQLKDKKATQELLTDPEIRNNLQKLADEVFPQGSLDQWMKELREKKELLEDTKPGDWARKAIQGKGDSGSIPKQKN